MTLTAQDLAVGDPYKGAYITEVLPCGSHVEIEVDRTVVTDTNVPVRGFVLLATEEIPEADLVAPPAPVVLPAHITYTEGYVTIHMPGNHRIAFGLDTGGEVVDVVATFMLAVNNTDSGGRVKLSHRAAEWNGQVQK